MMNDITSTLQYLNTGVQQGSDLGPRFFSLYLNDLSRILGSFEIIMYADDIALICTADNVFELKAQVNSEVQKISHWFHDNRLIVKFKKTKYTIFHSRRKLFSYEGSQIKIDKYVLEDTETLKYLGIILDNHVHWAGQ